MPVASHTESPQGRVVAPRVRDVLMRAELAAWLASFLFVATAGGVFAFLLAGRVDPVGLVLGMGLPAAVLALWGTAIWGERDGWRARVVECLFSFALVVAVVGHLMHPRGAGLSAWLPPLVGSPTLGVTLAVAGLLLVPLAAGMHQRAMRWTLDVAGTTALSSSWGFDLSLASADDVPVPRPTSAAAKLGRLFAAWFDGLLLPGRLAWHLLLLVTRAFVTLLTRSARESIHADMAPAALREALESVGMRCVSPGLARRGWVVGVPRQGGTEPPIQELGTVVVSWTQTRFPRAEASTVLHLSGPQAAVSRLRHVLESDLAHRMRFTWSRAARRLEARLDMLAQDIEASRSVEEQGMLLQELGRLQAVISHAALREEEARWLVDWKARRAHIRLQERMLDAASAPPREPATHVLGPGPTLLPDVSQLMDAGGLAAVRDLVHVPHHVVPLATRRGDGHVVVDALTQRVDIQESRRLLEALERQAPRVLLPERQSVRFLQAAPATAALAGEIRREVEDVKRDAWTPAAMDLVFVPFVEVDGKWRNAVTGTETAFPEGRVQTVQRRQ